MGFLTEIALFFLGLIGIYVGLHDFLGLNIIPYSFFDVYLAPAFVSFLFISLVSLGYWLYRIKKQPLRKKGVQVLKVTTIILALGIFLTSIPLAASSALKLLFGKLLIVAGIVLGYLAIKASKRKNSCEMEPNREKDRLF